MPEFEERSADWLLWEEAVARTLAAAPTLPSLRIPLADAFGLALAEELRAPTTLPPGPTSAMDGYAVRAGDLQAAAGEAIRLTLRGTSRPGDLPLPPLSAGEAARIMTGGLLPSGADTVVPVERTAGEEGDRVLILDPPPPGAFVRPAGEEMGAGDTLASPGDSLTAGLVALLASAGIREIPAVAPPKVALIVTGDELIGLEESAGAQGERPFRIDVMSPTFPHLIREAGGTPLQPVRAADSRGALREAFEQVARSADLILTTGGASMGEGDLVKRTLDELSFRLDFWRAKIRPGSPVGLGTLAAAGRPRRIPVLSLPGNPVSAFVTFLVMARPAVRRMGGHRRLYLPRVRCTLREPLAGAEGLTHFFRVRLEAEGEGRWGARSSAPQGSGVIRSLAGADGLAILPEGQGSLGVGSEVEVLLLPHRGWPDPALPEG